MGGANIKTFDGMLGMKYDMTGGATVFGVIKMAAEMNLPINVVGVVAAAENMTDGNNSRPEDIITTMSGKTVEIMNYSAASDRVLEELQLPYSFLKLIHYLQLVLNILPDNFFICIAYRLNKITLSPKLTSPKIALLNFRMQLEKFSSRYTFNHLHNL